MCTYILIFQALGYIRAIYPRSQFLNFDDDEVYHDKIKVPDTEFPATPRRYEETAPQYQQPRPSEQTTNCKCDVQDSEPLVLSHNYGGRPVQDPPRLETGYFFQDGNPLLVRI